MTTKGFGGFKFIDVRTRGGGKSVFEELAVRIFANRLLDFNFNF